MGSTYAPITSQTRSGAASPVENLIFRQELADWENGLWSFIVSSTPRLKSGIGEIKWMNRKQYIQDKLYMLKNEMVCTITFDDVRYLCEHCVGASDIDAYCRAIYDRNMETYVFTEDAYE